MKKGFAFYLILSVLSFFACSDLNQKRDTIRVATFNIERLGEKDKNMNRTAEVISNFDVVGILEVMEPKAVSNLASNLNVGKDSSRWKFLISSTWQGSYYYHEYVAYVWDTSRVSLVSNLGFYPDTNDCFTRAPYAATFDSASGNMDFTLEIVHIIWAGSTSADVERRRSEICSLPATLTWFDNLNGSDEDLLLGGDFNLPANDSSFRGLYDHFYTNSLPTNAKTTLTSQGPHSPYDHIFYSRIFTATEFKSSGIFDFSGGDYPSAVKEVSDHLPVYVELDSVQDDD